VHLARVPRGKLRAAVPHPIARHLRHPRNAALIVLAASLAVRIGAAQAQVPPPAHSASTPAASTASEPPAGCDWYWEFDLGAPMPGGEALVRMSFDAGSRTRTELRLPDAATLRPLADDPRVEPVPGQPSLRALVHAAGGRVSWHLGVRLAPGAPATFAPLAYAGALAAVLPLPTGPQMRQMCLAFSGVEPAGTYFSNRGQVVSQLPLVRWQATPAQAADWVVAAGRLGWQPFAIEGQTWTLWMPDPDAAAPVFERLTRALPHEVGLMRRHWGDATAREQVLMAWSLPAGAHPVQALVGGVALLGWPLTGRAATAGTGDGASAEAAPAATGGVGQTPPIEPPDLLALAHEAMLAERFGALAYDHRPQVTMQPWFNRGLASFLAQRLRSAHGLWSLDEHARALTPWLSQPMGVASPWLGMKWHGALVAKGHPGLEAVLRPLMRPADDSAAAGPLSEPLAGHRLIAALRPWLGDEPRGDAVAVQRGQGVGDPRAWLGPCFQPDATGVAVQPVSTADRQAGTCAAWLGTGLDTAAAVAAAARGPVLHKDRKPQKATQKATGAKKASANTAPRAGSAKGQRASKANPAR
jgi:hypothetical protein